MYIEGFDYIKKHFNECRPQPDYKSFLTIHKMKDGTPFAIICKKYEIEAVCFKNGRIQRLCVGLFSIKKDADGYKYLHLVFIKSNEAKRGVGRQVINVLKDHGIKNNCKYIWLLSVQSAEEFYEKTGFKRSDRIRKISHFSFDLDKISKIPITKINRRVEV